LIELTIEQEKKESNNKTVEDQQMQDNILNRLLDYSNNDSNNEARVLFQLRATRNIQNQKIAHDITIVTCSQFRFLNADASLRDAANI